MRIGNGEHLTIKGTIAITSYKDTKTIIDVLFVQEIDQNLLSIGQLLEKGYKVMFENKHYLIKDVDGKDLFKVEMKGTSFALNPMEEEHIAFKSKENATEIWHKRLGYFHLLGLLKKLGEGLSDLDDDLTYYRACKFGKNISNHSLNKLGEL